MHQKVTITLPSVLIEDLSENIKKGDKSKFIAEAIQDKIRRERLDGSTSNYRKALRNLVEMRKKLPKFSREEILESIRRGRA